MHLEWKKWKKNSLVFFLLKDPLPCFLLQWYQCSPELLGESVKSLFIQSHLDSGTSAFLKKTIEKSGWIFTQLYHSFISTIFSPLVSRTSINGSVAVQIYFHFCYIKLTLILFLNASGFLVVAPCLCFLLSSSSDCCRSIQSGGLRGFWTWVLEMEESLKWWQSISGRSM